MKEDEIIEKEPTEAIIPDDELEFDLEDTEDVEALKERNEKLEKFARQSVARAKKAEEENKLLKKPKEVPATQPASPNVEETVLLANGMDEGLLEELKAVAKVRNVSLIKAQADPIFVAIKDKFEKDSKEKNASLPASRGSGQVKPKKDFNTPGLSEADRKEMFEARFNQ